MKIRILNLSLTNFKKARAQSFSFGDVTNIFGANGSGKTTIKDAALWLLFGKDSTNSKNFGIKTLDENNQPYHNLDHEVEATLDVNGETIVIKRSMREKWVKRRGDVTSEFKGHETNFFWNDVPCQLNEYQAKVDALINEDVFKLVTSPSYFNALDWKVRRSTLLSIAGEITKDQVINRMIINGHTPHQRLLEALSKNKTADALKAELSAKKKTIKDELQLIPSRIDEANRSLPEETDFASIEKAKLVAENDLQVVESELLDITRQVQKFQNEKADKIKLQGQKRLELNNAQNAIQQQFYNNQQARKDNIASLQRDLQSRQTELSDLTRRLLLEQTKLNGFKATQQTLRQQWADKNAEQLKFNESEFACPTCKRAFEGVDIDVKKEEFTKNFNAEKSKQLGKIQLDGTNLSNDVAKLESEIITIQNKIAELNNDIEVKTQNIASFTTQHNLSVQNEAGEMEASIAADATCNNILVQINKLQDQIDADVDPISNATQLQRKEDLAKEINAYTVRLASKSQRENIIRRITELKNQEATMSADLADLEAVELSIEKFVKEEMNELDERINGRFELVKFKLFETQINGGETACCETLVNGVPFPDLNTASKINAGLDIINTLCDHYDVSAPIFIDNRESVTDILPTDAQVINLFVSPADTKLRVEVKVKETEEAMA